jgi:drug/metabolite transporter (DMT)-like permease
MIATMIQSYVYSLISALFIGIHLFSISYLKKSVKSYSSLFYIICILSFGLFLASRYFIYIASSQLPITNIHILLNMSVIVSTLLSVFVYQTKIKWSLFFIGFALVLMGIYCIQHAVELYDYFS